MAAFSRNSGTGVLTQLTDPSDCIADDGATEGCVDGSGLLNATAIVVSPDGNHVYVAAPSSDSVVAFSRNSTTGALTQLADPNECIAHLAAGGCATGTGLNGAWDLAISPDGANIYVASKDSDAVAVFSRNSTSGILTQLSDPNDCVSHDGPANSCTDVRALDGAQGVAVSPDGQEVYVSSVVCDSVSVFSRNQTTGALTQWSNTDGCVSETGSDGAAGTCVAGRGLDGTHRVTVARDGKDVYSGGLTGAVGYVSSFTRTR